MTVQFTFRIPIEIAELIDKQEGRNRTEKLLSLINQCNQTQSDVISERNQVQSNVISECNQTQSDVIKKLDELEQRIKRLESNVAPKQTQTSVTELITEEISKLTREEINTINAARFPLATLREFTAISRTQCDRHKALIFELLGYSLTPKI